MKTRLIAVLVVVAGLVAACSSGEGTGGQLDGTKWILRSYLVDSTLTLVPDTEYADAEFDASRVSGFGGCNRFDALYRTGGRTLFITDPASTLMACASRRWTSRPRTSPCSARAASTPRAPTRSRSSARAARRSSCSTPRPRTRSSAAGTSTRTRTPRARSSPSCPAPSWTWCSGSATSAGFAGCNQFSGTYGTNGNVVRIGQLATTRIACADDVMTQETAFLAALQGAALIEARTTAVTLQDLNGSPNVFLVRPPEAVESSAPPEAAATPKPTEKATEKPTPTKPTASPTPKPTPSPTPKPTATPTTAPPPTFAPDVATCPLNTADDVKVAKITYPASWSTVTTPANLACQYFDPAPITVPADPTTLVTASWRRPRPRRSRTPWPRRPTRSWDVTATEDLTLSGLDATAIAATATADSAGIPVGTSRYAYLVNVGSSGTVTMWTIGTVGEGEFANDSTILSLMVAQSNFVAGP